MSSNFLTSIPPGADPNDYDFDHPKAVDFDYMYKCLNDLKNMRDTYIPEYSFISNARTGKFKKIQAKRFVMAEGILALYDQVAPCLMLETQRSDGHQDFHSLRP